jgi:hypothetical protein
VATGPPVRAQRPSVVVLNLRVGDVALVAPSSKRLRHHSGSPTLPACRPCRRWKVLHHHSSPSHPPPPSPPPPMTSLLGALHRRPWFEMRVIPRSLATNATEEALSSSLVALVGGTRPVVSPDQVVAFLSHHHGVAVGEALIHRYKAGSFLISFNDIRSADRVLHPPPPVGVELLLIFNMAPGSAEGSDLSSYWAAA